METRANSVGRFSVAPSKYVVGIMGNLNTKRILIIDDEVNVRIVVKSCLEALGGWQVLVATSGVEGVAIAQKEKPDAIVLDVTMPGMSGVNVIQELQASPETQTIPVVFLTARASFTEPQRYSELGAKGAISKPFNPLTLSAQIAKAVGWEQDSQDKSSN